MESINKNLGYREEVFIIGLLWPMRLHVCVI